MIRKFAANDCGPEHIRQEIYDVGVAVLTGLFSKQECLHFIKEVDTVLDGGGAAVKNAEGSILGAFQGAQSRTLHGLLAAVPSAVEMVTRHPLPAIAQEVMRDHTDSILLTVAEYMGRNPGAPRQDLHRDTFTWRHAHQGEHPLGLNVMAAMTPFSKENGGTWFIPRSFGGAATQAAPPWEEAVQVELEQGDAVVFRADIFHAGGENTTGDKVRRILSYGYQVAWLRTVENYTLSLPLDFVRTLPADVVGLLGFKPDLVLGLYEGADPRKVLDLPGAEEGLIDMSIDGVDGAFGESAG